MGRVLWDCVDMGDLGLLLRVVGIEPGEKILQFDLCTDWDFWILTSGDEYFAAFRLCHKTLSRIGEMIIKTNLPKFEGIFDPLNFHPCHRTPQPYILIIQRDQFIRRRIILQTKYFLIADTLFRFLKPWLKFKTRCRLFQISWTF